PIMVNGAATEHRFAVSVDFRDATSGAVRRFNISSKGVPYGQKDEHELALAPGEWVTAIHLDGKKLEDTLTLYGFLGLTEASQLVRRTKFASTFGAIRAVGVGLLIATIVLVLVAGMIFYAD